MSVFPKISAKITVVFKDKELEDYHVMTSVNKIDKTDKDKEVTEAANMEDEIKVMFVDIDRTLTDNIYRIYFL